MPMTPRLTCNRGKSGIFSWSGEYPKVSPAQLSKRSHLKVGRFSCGELFSPGHSGDMPKYSNLLTANILTVIGYETLGRLRQYPIVFQVPLRRHELPDNFLDLLNR
jgi:hypothetical protein